MGVRVKEDGESESRLVMGRIGVALSGKITPRESGQTSIRSFLTREPELPTSGTKQLTAVETQAGAVPHEQIDWTTVRLQKSCRIFSHKWFWRQVGERVDGGENIDE
jgi:hypothetical protein